jgi:hypothetical protein
MHRCEVGATADHGHDGFGDRKCFRQPGHAKSLKNGPLSLRLPIGPVTVEA